MFASNVRLKAVLLLFTVLFLTVTVLFVYDKWSTDGTAAAPWIDVNDEMESLLKTIPDENNEKNAKSDQAPNAKNENSVIHQSEPTDIEKTDKQQQPQDVQRSDSNLIDINTASMEELDTLPGIGPSKAKGIVDYREQHGKFTSPEQLMEVKGIGPKMFEKIKAKVKISNNP